MAKLLISREIHPKSEFYDVFSEVLIYSLLYFSIKSYYFDLILSTFIRLSLCPQNPIEIDLASPRGLQAFFY